MTARKADSSNAITLLTDDHKEVKRLFKEFEKGKDSMEVADKEELVNQICEELLLHTEVEEQIFYPAARAAIEDDDMMNEAEVEHSAARDLIEQLRGMDPADEMYDAKVTVLGEQVEHHIEEEEKEMFPKVKKAKLDLDTLGEQIQQMKDASGMPPPTEGKASGQRAARH